MRQPRRRQQQPELAVHLTISETGMQAALSRREAVPFSPVARFLIRYQDTWWLSTDIGWLPVHPALAAILSHHAALPGQDRRTADQAAIRAVIDLARNASTSGHG